MKVSLNWVKKYVDLPDDLTYDQIAYDMTMRTVEVEDVIYTGDKFHDIVVGQIISVEQHPNADLLKVCVVDIGDGEPKQIVCGGSNLYAGEKVVVSKPGSVVYWHGGDELVPIKESKMRGVSSYGMICGCTEVFLEQLFPVDDPRIIVDLSDIDCYPGQNIADVVYMNDVVFDIDNKSLTNRPDLWGHYGIARELSAIYNVPLKPLPEYKVPEGTPKYKVTVEEPDRCPRYVAVEIDDLYVKESPLWMKAAIINGGMRPINAIVDITNYIMMDVGQPTHGFDRTHVEGEEIVVRLAHEGEELELLNSDMLDLTTSDLVICDTKEPMGLAGIRGGKKDSILPETTGIVLEIASFTAPGLRKTESRFDEKTDASIRYEKGIDTQRVDQGLAVALQLFSEIYPECHIVAFEDLKAEETEANVIEVTQEFLDIRLGKVLTPQEVTDILERLGYVVDYKDEVYTVVAPTWRSTGDVTVKDDVMGDVARILGYEMFEAKPLPVNFTSSVHQPKENIDRNIREFLAYRCGMYEIFTYPWVDVKYIDAARIDKSNAVRLATPPSPEMVNLRQSLIPGHLEAIVKNLRYFSDFKIFEVAQCFEQGEYSPTVPEEVLPVHNMMLTACFVGKDARELFFEAKGVLEAMSGYCHIESFSFKQVEKPTWADKDVYLNIIAESGEMLGSLGLVSVACKNDAGIKRAQVAAFEINIDKITPLPSRTNEFEHLPQFPLVEQDLSIVVDESVTWEQIKSCFDKMVKNVRFVEEYRGEQIPEGKKSIMFHVTFGNDDSTMTSKQIEKKMAGIVKNLKKKVKAELRD